MFNQCINRFLVSILDTKSQFLFFFISQQGDFANFFEIKTSTIPYNAAVIKACNGDIDGALDLLNEVRSMVNNNDVNRLYVKLLDLKKRN